MSGSRMTRRVYGNPAAKRHAMKVIDRLNSARKYSMTRQMYPRRDFVKPTEEIKYVDVLQGTTALTPLTTGSGNVLCNGVLSGAGIANRVGALIRHKYLEVRWQIKYNQMIAAAGGTLDSDACRFMVIYDRQPNGTQWAVADVIGGYDQNNAQLAVTAGNQTDSHPNPTRKDRFSVLKDFKVNLAGISAGTAAASTSISIPVPDLAGTFHVSLRGLTSRYSTNTGGIGDIQTGSLYLLFFTNQDYTANPFWQVMLQTRFCFSD